MTRQPLGVATAKTRRPTVRARRGAPTRRRPRAPAPARRAPTPGRRSAAAAAGCAGAAPRASSAERLPTTIDGSLGERSIGLMIEPLRALPRVLERGRLAQPPGRDRRQLQRLAEQLAAEARQVAEQRARLEHARAERVGEQHVAAPRAIGQAGDAERGIGAQLERIAVVVVLAAHDRVDALQAVDRLQPDAVVAHRQVAALDEREAEVAGEQRVLEVGLVVRPRREQDDPRRRRRRAAPSAAATSAGRRRSWRGAAPAARGTSAGRRARRRGGSRARSPSPKAPGCGR